MARQKDVTTELWRGIGSVVVGVALVIYFAKDLFNSFTDPGYLYDLSVEEIKDGAYVQEDINVALDYFMYEETTRSRYGIETSSTISAYYYIVPVLTEDLEEELYMAVEVGPSAESAMNSICDDTYEYLIGEMEEYRFGYNSYHVTGSIRDMKAEELQYMIEWFQATEYFGTTNAEEIKQYIHPVVLEKYNGTMARIMTVVAGLFILVGLLMIKHCSGVRRRQKKEEEYRVAHRNRYESRYPQPNSAYPGGNMYQQNGAYPQESMYQPNGVYQPGNAQQPGGTQMPDYGQNVYTPGSNMQMNNTYNQPQNYGQNVYMPGSNMQMNNTYNQPQNYGQNVYTPGSNMQMNNTYNQPQNQDDYLYNPTYDNEQ